MTPAELALIRENLKLQREVEELKRNRPMTAQDHLKIMEKRSKIPNNAIHST